MLVLLLLSVVLFRSGSFAEQPKLAVMIVKSGGVPESVLRAADAYYASVFRKIGIEVESMHWTAASSGSEPGHSAIVIRVLSAEVAGGIRRAAGCLGAALPSDTPLHGTAIIFYDRVKAVSSSRSRSLPRLLAHAMAHETGHLLLGKGHSVRGVMKGIWSGPEFAEIDQGQAPFAAGEADRLRRSLARLELSQRRGPVCPGCPTIQ